MVLAATSLNLGVSRFLRRFCVLILIFILAQFLSWEVTLFFLERSKENLIEAEKVSFQTRQKGGLAIKTRPPRDKLL